MAAPPTATSSETVEIELDGRAVTVSASSTILQAILAIGQAFPHVCYHPALGPLETCDTCIAEVNGQLVRACATQVSADMKIRTHGGQSAMARDEAMNRILRNHDLYCTVCDNNNGNCVIHNTAELMRVEHQKYPFAAKGYPTDTSNPFYRYVPINASSAVAVWRLVRTCR